MDGKNYSERLRIVAELNLKEKDFWLKQLAGELVKSHFPYDYKKKGAYSDEAAAFDSTDFKCDEETAAKLTALSKGSNYTLNLLLITGVILLLHKYTGDRDIIVGAPIYEQETEGDFINTTLVLRNPVEDGVTFKEFLLQVRQTITDAVENQNYPIGLLTEKLNPGADIFEDGSPLFDVAVLLENIHNKKYLQGIPCSLTFTFRKDAPVGSVPYITGIVEYNMALYEKSTVEKLAGHLNNLLREAVFNVDLPLSHLDMLSPQEKKQILKDFNNTGAGYPTGKTIHRWFEEQVEKTPDKTAVCSPFDLDDIYDRLEFGGTAAGGIEQMETCCFKKNPYTHLTHLEQFPPQSGWTLLKTNRHNSVIVNRNMAELIVLFDGKRNLKSIYNRVKAVDAKGAAFLIYSMNKTDLLEVSFRFNDRPEIFAVDEFEDLVQLIQSLYREHLIYLAGINAGGTGPQTPESQGGGFETDVPGELRIDRFWRKDEETTKARLLLLGDTPGTPTTGLLYLGSYLMRKGIKTRCRFYDPGTDYASMKENIESLLEQVQPGIVAVSLKWFLYIARVIDMCEIVKKYAQKHSRDIKVVVGGNTASYYRRDMAAYDCIDYLVRGDGEKPLLNICRGEKEENIPNLIYKKNGEIVENPVTYVQDETNSREIYLSHLDEMLLSDHASLLGSFFIYTHKGCAMNCLYCGGCSRAQRETFNRKNVLKRDIDSVRTDIEVAKKYTSTFQFDFDITDAKLVDYCKSIWEGIDLSGHFCIFAASSPPTSELIELVSVTFRYVYWDFDICSLSERHRKQLFSLGLVKPQPSDDDILAFMAGCEPYPNIEVRLNLITGLPHFTEEDIGPGEKLLARVMHTYSRFGELHWARLHAQPGAPILEDTGKYGMHSYAASFEDFLKYSGRNFDRSSHYASVENIDYPYIYFNDDRLNSRITNFYLESNKKIAQFQSGKRRHLIAGDTLNYRQLNAAADRLAGVLRTGGVTSGSIVALLFDRSLDIPTAILGVLKAGCAYLPIDPESPVERIRYMLENSNSAALVTKADDGRNIGGWKGKTIFLEDPVTAAGEVAREVEGSRSGDTLSSDIVYVIYTSGTTGKPKGVLLKHENLVNYVNWFTETANLTVADNTVLTSSFAFDLGYTSLYSSLLNGCELHILPREIYLLAERLLDYIQQREITYLKMTPSLFSTIVNSPGFSMEKCRLLRLVAVGGEAINVEDIGKAHSVCGHMRVMNHYGPTEATIGSVATFVDFHRFDEYRKHPVIGKPIFNTRVYILNKDLGLLPVGTAGELCIAGTCIARGYLNRPELTAEKFNRSYKSGRSYILYRTGDLARWLPDGTVEFLGRIDEQVKIRGYRVELGEIESRLLKHPQVDESLVVVKEKEAGTGKTEKYICAYIVSKEEKNRVHGMPGAPGGSKTANVETVSKLKDILIGEAPALPVGSNHSSIVGFFEEQVEKNGDNIVVNSVDSSWTYQFLDRYGESVARVILENYDDRYKLSREERIRYKRQMLLFGWGQQSQEKLKGTTVFVAGAGGGASPTIVQLALAGFGTIKVCDFDEVELSNLNRQFLHDGERLGMNKALSARMTIEKTNPHVKVIPYTRKLTRENVFEMVGDADIIFDMFDGPADKFVLSECAVAKGIPHVIISMTDINAYTAVLHTPETPCFHCIFDRKKLETIVTGMQNYVENYSKNPLPVVATSLFVSTGTAVNEALKVLLGFNEPAYNKFFYFNQRGKEENLVYTPGYKAMTYLFSDHFLRLCKEQGFDWEVGWRGNFLEELELKPDPHCPLCSSAGGKLRKNLEENLQNIKREAVVEKETGTNETLQTVALLFSRNNALAAGIVGALKSGKIYVLLESTLPTDRLAHILEDSESRLILTDGDFLRLAEKLRDKVNKNIKVIDITESSALPAQERLNIRIDPEQPVYLLYSPVSSGAPGTGDDVVKENHRELLDFIKTYNGNLRLHSPERDNYSLRAGMIDFYSALINGTDAYVFENCSPWVDRGTVSSELREYLQRELPAYMLPAHFVRLDRMPLTPNGKIDRKALPDPEIETVDDGIAPRNEIEEKLAAIWSDVLEIEKERIGINSNFFELGGHSLKATIMAAKVHKELNVKLPVGEIFKTPTISDLSSFINAAEKNIYNSIQPVEQKEYYPLSSAQMRMFLLNQIKGAATSENTPGVFIVEGVMDRQHLEDIINWLIARHEVLRTSFEMVHHQPVQRVHRSVPLKIRDIRAGNGSEPVPDEEIKRIIDDFVQPFDLGKPPLIRVGLLKVEEQKHFLIYDMHHIVSDGTSFQIFIREFIALHEGVTLTPLRIQYKDFSDWQYNLALSGALKKQEAYWLDVFSHEPPPLDLPTDYPRREVQGFEGDFIEFLVENGIINDIQAIASEIGATLYMALLAIFYTLLNKYTGREDIVVGSSSAGRPHTDLQNVIGFFVNTLAMRNYPREERTFIDFLEEVKINSLNAYENQDYQFDELVKRLGAQREVGRQALFDTHFTLHNVFVEADENLPGVGIRDLRFSSYRVEEKTTQFDIIIHANEVRDGVLFTLRYSTALFRKETIQRFVDNYREITGIVIENKNLKLKDIKISHDLETARVNMPQVDFNF
jgi:amino acid adenylation domain-containing protein